VKLSALVSKAPDEVFVSAFDKRPIGSKVFLTFLPEGYVCSTRAPERL